MKKVLLMTVVFSAIIVTATQAQTGSGPAASSQQAKEADAATMLQQTKEKVRPLMVEKTGITEAQADKVIEILFEMRQGASTVSALNEEDRSKKLAELKATKDKKFSELLTNEQIAAVKAFYQEMNKNAPPN